MQRPHGILTFIVSFAGLCCTVEPTDNYQRTRLTKKGMLEGMPALTGEWTSTLTGCWRSMIAGISAMLSGPAGTISLIAHGKLLASFYSKLVYAVPCIIIT